MKMMEGGISNYLGGGGEGVGRAVWNMKTLLTANKHLYLCLLSLLLICKSFFARPASSVDKLADSLNCKSYEPNPAVV